ncbi:PAS domain S-box protein [Desulfosediminicola flagellatus]|uniref:PAS domain S-box protein n=1 Tax=Desulfosediminicola flagellatus TaxID=2569541 RepID=UPI0010ABE7D3|nr:PAS domain S-box protein [Desulfosediminicola flagellatus]
MKFRKSFRLKTIFGIAFIEAILLGIIGITSLNFLAKSNVDNITEYAKTTATLFATTTKNAVLSTDLASLESYVNELSSNPKILFCRVVSSDLGTLAESGSASSLKQPFIPSNSFEDIHDNVFNVRAEIEEADFVYGHVELGIDIRSFLQIMDQARSRFIALATLEMLLVAIFSAILGYFLTRQLNSLVDGANQIASGNFEYRIPVKSRDELGQTAHVFNDMSAKLKQTYHSLSVALDDANDKRKKLESEEGRLRAILNSVVDPLISIDTTGKIAIFNPAAERTFGYSTEEVIGKNVSMIMPAPYSKEHDSYLQRYLTEGEPRIINVGREVIARKKTGEQFPAELSVSEVKLGDEHYFIGLLRDISERKEAEKTILSARKKAEQASEAKSTFLANMSHELRTPLNAILGYAQILLDLENLQPIQIKGLETIKSSGQHLLQLIIDILDISKIEAGNLELDAQVYNFPNLLKDIEDMINIRAVEKGIQFNVWKCHDIPTNVYGDSKRLSQIILNLLTNALKFTDKGMVMFKIDRAKPDISGSSENSVPLQNILRFEIQDTGIGISKMQQQHIFKPFYQATDIRLSSEGAGLGLSITRQLLNLMGSDLYLKSTPGEGSTFWFDLNLEEQKGNRLKSLKESKKITGYTGPATRILVVDDVADNRNVLRYMLMPLGFEIEEAENGEQCLQKIAKRTPDLILLDLRMPVMDGFEALKQIRNNPATQELPVIAISASVSPKKIKEVMASGCNNYISKPFKKTNLLKILGETLNLEWLFTEQKRPAKADKTLRGPDTPLSKLPDDIIREIVTHAERGSVRKLQEIADTISTSATIDTEWQHVLIPLIRKYKFQEILDIFNNEKTT